MTPSPTTRTNDEWLADLGAPGPAREAALGDLHAIILAGLPYALSKWLSPSDPQFEALAQDVAQDTLIRVLDRLDSFESRSRFTTWVHKIAVRLALTELRRRRWRDRSLDEMLEGEIGPADQRLMADPESTPEEKTEQADMLAIVQRMIMEELTDKQRRAMQAVGVQGVPMGVVAERMGTNRNALYKLMHNARLRLKQRLEKEGLTPGELLAAFEVSKT